MAELLPTILTVAGSVVGTLLTVLGVRYVARQSAKAAERTSDVESRKVDVGEWQAILTALREEVARLSVRLSAVEQELSTSRENTHQLLAFTRSLIAIIYRLAPEHPIPTPPAAFVDELSYITEGHRP